MTDVTYWRVSIAFDTTSELWDHADIEHAIRTFLADHLAADHIDLGVNVVDRSHFPLCDWNLYPESRGDSRPGTDDGGCNINCENKPQEVSCSWSRWEARG